MQSSWTPDSLRAFEQEVKEAFLTGSVHGPVHLSGGNEEPLIEIFRDVQPGDWVFSTHRSHYHALLKGVPPELVKAEVLKGWSIHLNYKTYRFMSSAIVGGCLPVALGVALAIKRRGEDRKAWCFIGDMAWEAGITHECVKYARNFDLPLRVVVEDNGMSTNSPTREVWGIKEPPPPLGEVRAIEEWGNGKVLYYRYERIFPHINAGVFVTFR